MKQSSSHALQLRQRQHAAAVTMQRVFRGFLGRKEFARCTLERERGRLRAKQKKTAASHPPAPVPPRKSSAMSPKRLYDSLEAPMTALAMEHEPLIVTVQKKKITKSTEFKPHSLPRPAVLIQSVDSLSGQQEEIWEDAHGDEEHSLEIIEEEIDHLYDSLTYSKSLPMRRSLRPDQEFARNGVEEDEIEEYDSLQDSLEANPPILKVIKQSILRSSGSSIHSAPLGTKIALPEASYPAVREPSRDAGTSSIPRIQKKSMVDHIKEAYAAQAAPLFNQQAPSPAVPSPVRQSPLETPYASSTSTRAAVQPTAPVQRQPYSYAPPSQEERPLEKPGRVHRMEVMDSHEPSRNIADPSRPSLLQQQQQQPQRGNPPVPATRPILIDSSHAQPTTSPSTQPRPTSLPARADADDLAPRQKPPRPQPSSDPPRLRPDMAGPSPQSIQQSSKPSSIGATPSPSAIARPAQAAAPPRGPVPSAGAPLPTHAAQAAAGGGRSHRPQAGPAPSLPIHSSSSSSSQPAVGQAPAGKNPLRNSELLERQLLAELAMLDEKAARLTHAGAGAGAGTGPPPGQTREPLVPSKPAGGGPTGGGEGKARHRVAVEGDLDRKKEKLAFKPGARDTRSGKAAPPTDGRIPPQAAPSSSGPGGAVYAQQETSSGQKGKKPTPTSIASMREGRPPASLVINPVQIVEEWKQAAQRDAKGPLSPHVAKAAMDDQRVEGGGVSVAPSLGGFGGGNGYLSGFQKKKESLQQHQRSRSASRNRPDQSDAMSDGPRGVKAALMYNRNAPPLPMDLYHETVSLPPIVSPPEAVGRGGGDGKKIAYQHPLDAQVSRRVGSQRSTRSAPVHV